MIEKRYYQECLTEGQKKVIEAFNGLENGMEQERVVDILYDAVFDKNLKTTLSRDILKEKCREIEDLQATVEDLSHQVNHWKETTRAALNDGLTTKAERKAERKEVLEDDLSRSHIQTIKGLQSFINELQSTIKKFKSGVQWTGTND